MSVISKFVEIGEAVDLHGLPLSVTAGHFADGFAVEGTLRVGRALAVFDPRDEASRAQLRALIAALQELERCGYVG